MYWGVNSYHILGIYGKHCFESKESILYYFLSNNCSLTVRYFQVPVSLSHIVFLTLIPFVLNSLMTFLHNVSFDFLKPNSSDFSYSSKSKLKFLHSALVTIQPSSISCEQLALGKLLEALAYLKLYLF